MSLPTYLAATFGGSCLGYSIVPSALGALIGALVGIVAVLAAGLLG
jgi:hypothetical protein